MPSDEKDLKVAIGGVVDTVNKRVSGKLWKLKKTPTVRAQKAKSLRSTWEQRSEERAKLQSVKSLEKQLKDERKAEKDASRKREITLERKRIKEEKERYEALAAKMSAKRLQRLRKREARKKARV